MTLQRPDVQVGDMMRRLILGLAVCLLASPASSFTRVQGNTGTINGTGAVAVILTTPVGSGNAILISISHSSADTITVSSVTDNNSTPYTLVSGPTAYTVDPTFAVLTYWLANVTGGPTTFTATFSGTTTQGNRITVDEFSIAGAATLDGNAISAQGSISGTDAITSGNASAVTNGDLVWGTTIPYNGAGTISAGTGFSNGTLIASNVTTEWLTQSGAGPRAATFSNATADEYVTAIITIKPPGGAHTLTTLGVGE